MLFGDLFGTIVGAFMAVGPTMGYVAQWWEIRRSGTSGGFSLWVPFLLLTSNILRLLFRIGRTFETVLVVQSALMVVCQLLLLFECVRFLPRHQRGARLIDSPLRSFWAWGDFTSYVLFLIVFTAFFGMLTFIFVDSEPFIELLGYLALTTEAMLGVPQLITNFKKRSVAGLSKMLVATWFLGDGFKTVYFIITEAPVQFVVCGAVQLTVDVLITYQLFTYKQTYDLLEDASDTVTTEQATLPETMSDADIVGMDFDAEDGLTARSKGAHGAAIVDSDDGIAINGGGGGGVAASPSARKQHATHVTTVPLPARRFALGEDDDDDDDDATAAAATATAAVALGRAHGVTPVVHHHHPPLVHVQHRRRDDADDEIALDGDAASDLSPRAAAAAAAAAARHGPLTHPVVLTLPVHHTTGGARTAPLTTTAASGHAIELPSLASSTGSSSGASLSSTLPLAHLKPS